MENERSVAGDGKTKDCRVEGISKWISKWGKSSTVVIMGEKATKKLSLLNVAFHGRFAANAIREGSATLSCETSAPSRNSNGTAWRNIRSPASQGEQ